jgi:hypothetical protein
MTKVTNKRSAILIGGLCIAALFATACSSTDNSDMNYKAAINDHFKAAPACIWPESKKLPAQAATSDDAQTQGYDALTQAGLLVRTTAEKKVFIIASKQVNNYDLSDSGKTNWTPDPTQPGYGNFCYGTREVTSIDNSTVGANASGAKTASVNYHYKIANVPGWATSPGMTTAFPPISTALNSPEAAQATLVMNGDHWSYSGA